MQHSSQFNKSGADVIACVHQKKENRLDYAQKQFHEIAEQLPSDITPVSDILDDVFGILDYILTNLKGVNPSYI